MSLRQPGNWACIELGARPIFSPAIALHTRPTKIEAQRCRADLNIELGDRASVARAQAAAHQDNLYLGSNFWKQGDKQGRICQCSSADQCKWLRPAQETVLAEIIQSL